MCPNAHTQLVTSGNVASFGKGLKKTIKIEIIPQPFNLFFNVFKL